MITELENAIVKNRPDFYRMVDFNPAKEKLILFNFTDGNTE